MDLRGNIFDLGAYKNHQIKKQYLKLVMLGYGCCSAHSMLVLISLINKNKAKSEGRY